MNLQRGNSVCAGVRARAHMSRVVSCIFYFACVCLFMIWIFTCSCHFCFSCLSYLSFDSFMKNNVYLDTTGLFLAIV